MPHLSLFLTIALIAGLAGGVLAGMPSVLASSLILSGTWTFAVIAYRRSFPRVQFASLTVLVCTAGWLLGSHAVDRALHTPLRTRLEQRLGGFAIDPGPWARYQEPLVIEGRLRQDAEPTELGVVLRVDVERVWLGEVGESTSGGVSLGVGGAMHSAHAMQWTSGRRIRAPALLRRPARYLNEGLPDQERAMAQRGITLVGTIKSAALVEVVAPARWWEEYAAKLRARTRVALERHVRVRADQSAAIASAILIGDRAGLDEALERRLQEAGTYHVIAISGGNIAILAGSILWALAWFGVRGRLAALATIASLAAFALVAAGGASVARATLMAVIYLAVRLIDQRTAAPTAIGLTAGTLLVADPLAVVDVGFWLTFAASMAIIIGASRVTLPTSSLARAALTVFVATCCAELALAPVTALVFQRVTVAGLLLNFAALPAMTLVQLGAMAVVACDLLTLDRLATWTGHLVHLGSVVLVDSARLLDHAPWLSWRVPSPHPLVMTAYYMAVALCFCRLAADSWTRVVRASAFVAAGALFLWIVGAPQARVRASGDGQLHVTQIDVGQGDALLVTFPNGRTLIIDTGGISTGGDFDVGERVVGPSLRARHLVRLEYLAITHGDPDHIGGARSIVRDFQPMEVWWGVPVASHEPTAIVREEADRARSTWRTLQRGDRFEIGGVEVRVHHPPPPDWERQKVRNDDSIVLELRFGNVSVLLTGDIGREVEQQLVPILDLLPTVVLKVAHHGSATSSSAAFVEKVRPQVALVGVGRGNSYGHPVPQVLARYEAVGTEVFRTDIDGQVSVVTDGKNVTVSTWTGRRVVK